MQSLTWDMADDRRTAIGRVVPVIVAREVLATLCATWSDEDGVRLSLADDGALDDLNVTQALTLADAMREAATVAPPVVCGCRVGDPAGACCA